MVYILRLVPIYTSIDVPILIQFTDAFPLGSSHPLHGLTASNPFAGVFVYAVTFQKANCRETTVAMESGFPD